MKRLISILLACLSTNIAYSNDQAILSVKLSNPEHGYYVCLSNLGGCVNVVAMAQGKTVPIDSGQIKNMAVISTKNFRVYPQVLPDSCQVNIGPGQTLLVKGKVVSDTEGEFIDGLSCSLS